MTGAQLALLWVKDQPGVTAPIVGPRTLAHLEEFIPVLDMQLDDADRPLFDRTRSSGQRRGRLSQLNDWMKARITD